MTKKSFPAAGLLGAALVLSAAALFGLGLVYAAPSATLQVQIVPVGSGIACDIGPTYIGSIPAPAVAAGFTHCAANYDFSNATAYNNSNISTWLHCPDDGVPGAQFYANSPGYDGTIPCNDTSIAADPIDGINSLRILMPPSDFHSGYVSLLSISTRNYGAGTSFPTQFYAETVYRITTETLNLFASGGGTLVGGPFMNSPYSNDHGTSFLEQDYGELNSPDAANGSGIIGWQSVNGNPWGITFFGGWGTEVQMPGYDSTMYNVRGLRTTMDTSGHSGSCEYFNGSPINNRNGPCVSYTLGAGASDNAIIARNQNIIFFGADTGTPGSTPSTSYFRRGTIWTCAGWNTSNPAGDLAHACTGPVLTSP